MNQNEHAAYQNSWNTATAILKEKFAHGHLSSQRSKPSPQETKENNLC